MVQIFQAPEDPSTKYIQSIAGGFGQGLQQGVSTALQHMLAQKKFISSESGKIRSDLGKLVKQYGPGKFDATTQQNLEKRATQMLQEGLASNSAEATLAALQEFQNKQVSSLPTETAPIDTFDKIREAFGTRSSQEVLQGLKDLPQDFLGAAAKFGRPIVGAIDFPIQVLRELGYAGRKGLAEARGLSEDEFRKSEEKLASETKAGEEALGVPNIIGHGGTSLVDFYDKLTGGRGIAQDPVQRTIQALIGAGKPGAAANIFNELINELAPNLPPELKSAGEAATFVYAIKYGKNLKLPNLKANEKLITEADKISAKSGEPIEIVLEKAKVESGADFEKALAGDVKEINKIHRELKGEAAEISKRIEQLPKETFPTKKAIKEREIFGAKLPESPLEEYFKPERIPEKKHETIAKESEITSRLTPLEEKTNQNLQTQRSELRDLEAQRRGATGNALDRINASIELKKNQVSRIMDELKDIQYEMKYFRKRPTEAEIDTQIKKSAQEFVEHAKNPTPEKQRQIEKQLELDKKYIEQAEKLIERGELPGELRPDTFMKIKQKYIEGYNAAISQLRDEIRNLKGARDAESLKKIAENRKAINFLEGRNKRLKADLVNQGDKIKAIRALEKPSGAFYKQQLKGLKQDIEAFQKTFFRQVKHIKTPTELKVERIGKKGIENVEQAHKLGEEISKNPTKENVNEAASKTGEKSEEFKETFSEFRDKLKQRAEAAKKGDSTEIDVQKTTKEVQKGLARWQMRMKRLPKTIATAFSIGIVTGIIENETGHKIQGGFLGALLPGSASSRVSGFGASTYAHSLVNNFYDNIEADKLKKLRNTNAYEDHIEKLQKRYSKARVNRIVKASL